MSKSKYKNLKKLKTNMPTDFSLFWVKESHRLTPAERAIINKRLSSYTNLRYYEYKNCNNILGFDIDRDYDIKTPFNAKELYKCKYELSQNEVIPFSQNIMNYLLLLPKYKLFEQKFEKMKKNEKLYFKSTYYCARTKQDKIVLFCLLERTKTLDDSNKNSINSVNYYMLLQGYVPLLISRFDTCPSGIHPNKLNQSGNLPHEKSYVKGPHEHIYSEKLAVVYNFKRFVAHYDAIQQPKFEKFSQAVELIKNKYNLLEKEFLNSNKKFVNLPQKSLQQKQENVNIKEN